jgi:hypothetical protein
MRGGVDEAGDVGDGVVGDFCDRRCCDAVSDSLLLASSPYIGVARECLHGGHDDPFDS